MKICLRCWKVENPSIAISHRHVSTGFYAFLCVVVDLDYLSRNFGDEVYKPCLPYHYYVTRKGSGISVPIRIVSLGLLRLTLSNFHQVLLTMCYSARSFSMVGHDIAHLP